MTSPFLLAHGVGGRTDLPLSLWQAGWSAAVALVLSFAALGLLWHRPRLRNLSVGRPLASWAASLYLGWTAMLRLVVGVIAVVVVTAGLFGVDDVAANFSPVAVYVAFWVAVPLLVVVVGPVWSSISPWETVVRQVDLRKGGGRRGTLGLSTEMSDGVPVWVQDGWLAVMPVSIFLWLELVYHDGARPRVLGWVALGYTVLVAGMAAQWGAEAARRSEGFGVLFGLLARLAPFGRQLPSQGGVVQGQTGRLVLRTPLTGAAVDDLRSSEVTLLLIVLGSTAFDGVSRTRFWSDVSAGHVGWSATLVGTLGLLWVVGLVSVAWHLAARMGERLTGETGFSMRFGHSLLPIVLGYHVAHYFSLLMLEGQLFSVRASDPYGQGWDLFGTVDSPVNWTRVSPTTVGWVQLVAIVCGHLGGVLLAHDRSVETWRPMVALRSQYPLLVVMVVYTVFGLVLMTG
ncbi:MAG: hypothetical protein P8M16_01460 [Acidimicrobiales bacterium]|nr:hypothetical protein [Acidimicrobiales bacterium]